MFSKSNKSPLPTYDETSFEINYQHGQTQLQEIKVNYKWINQEWKYRLPKLNCQWFNKTSSAMEPISQVQGQTYQPSVLDVGTTIYLQMTPESKQMEYIGMPIIKFIGPLSLNSQTEEQVNELFEVGKSTYFIEISQIKLKGLPKMQSNLGVTPLKQCLIKIIKGNFVLIGKWNTSDKAQNIMDIKIGKQYPKLKIDRKNCKIIKIEFNKQQYAKVVLQNNRIRDVLYLVIQKIKQVCQESEQTQQKQVIKSSSSLSSAIKSEESLKKSEETLPTSPQTKVSYKVQKQLQIKIQEVKQDSKEQQNSDQKKLQLGIQQLLTQISTLRQSLSQVKNKQVQTQKRAQKVKEQACYHQNQCRLLKEKLLSQQRHNQQNQKKIQQLSKRVELSISNEQAQKIFGKYAQLTLKQALENLLSKDQQIKDLISKYKYQQQNSQKYDIEIKDLSEEIEMNQSIIRNFEKKVQSLTKDKSVLAQQVSTQHTYSSQLDSYLFQIGKLKQQIKIAQQSKALQIQSKDKQINSLKIQVKELIQENTYLRSKQKSSKSELKNQMVELKKLVNRFGESMAEKDIQIDNLRMANKQLNKELVILREKAK